MSDDMEREKREQLTAREIEMEEMKRELTVIGIYEPGITYEEMKTLLGFLNVPLDNKNAQKGNAQQSDNERLSETTSETTDGLQEQAVTQERAEISKSTYKLNRTSPTAQEHKPVRYSSSPESPSIFDVRNSVYRCKSVSDSDETAEKQHEGANNFISLRTGNVTRENVTCQNATETKPTTQSAAQSEYNQRLDRWRLNPLDACVNDNDVPLQQPNRPPARERLPFRYCKETHTSEQRDQVMEALNQHLKDMTDLWYSWQHPADSKFQWGSPIQVGIANGSLDRKPLTDPKTEPIKMERTYRDNYERASKRKASSVIASLNKENSSEDDEDDVYDFNPVKKKKVQSDGKSGNVDRANQHARASKQREKIISGVVTRQQSSTNDRDDSNTSRDESEDKSLCFGRGADEENERLSPELITRRIVSPRPRARLSLFRHRGRGGNVKPFQKLRRIGENDNVEQRKCQKKDDILTDEEIRQELEKDNEDEKEAGAAVKKNAEILPLSRELQSTRLQERRSSSNNAETIKEMKTVSKEKEIDRQRNRERKTELGERRGEKERLYKVENRNESWEHQLMSPTKDESPEISQEPDVQNGNQCDDVLTSSDIRCPICNKLFPHDEIMNHAAYCEQYETNNEEDDNVTDEFVCNVCDNYKTDNGIQYKKHVQQCNKNNKKNLQALCTGYEGTAESIKEEKDSETDCKAPSLSQSKTKVITGRKRKH